MRRAPIQVLLLAGANAAVTFAREVLFGRVFGVGSQGDAFFSAYTISVVLVTVVITGAVVFAALPVIERAGAFGATRGAVESSVLVATIVPLAVIVVPALFLSMTVMGVAAPGLSRSTRVDAAAILTALTPSMALGGFALVASRISQSRENWILAGALPILASAPVLAILIWAVSGQQSSTTGQTVGWAVSAGAVLQVAVAVAALLRRLTLPSPAIVLRVVREMAKLVPWLLAYQVLAYFNVVLERALASTLGSGAVSEFNYGFRIFAILPTFVVVPLASVFAGRYAKRAAATLRGSGDGQSSAYLERWLGFAIVGSAGAGALFTFAAPALVSTFYGERLGAEGSNWTALVLVTYGIAAVPAVLGNLLVTAAVGSGSTKRLVAVSAADAVVYAAAAVALKDAFGIVGLAAARALSFWLVFATLTVLSARQRAFELRSLRFPAGVAGIAFAVAGVAFRVLGSQSIGLAPAVVLLGGITTYLVAVAVLVRLGRGSWTAYALIRPSTGP